MKKVLLSSAALALMSSPALAQQPSCRSVPMTVLLSHYENPPAGYTGKGGCIICVINDVTAAMAAMRPAGKVGAAFALRITTLVEQQPDGTSKVSLESETPNTEIDEALPKARQNEAQREIKLLEAKLKRFSVLLPSRATESDAEQALKLTELFSHLRLLERPDLKIELCDPAAADSPILEMEKDPQTGEWTIVRKLPNGEELRTLLRHFVSEFGAEIVRETAPDGQMRESVLWPDGTVTTLRNYSNGDKEMTTLSPSGQFDHVETRPDGTFSHQTRHPDGTLVTEHRRADGSLVDVVTQHPDGWVERRDASGSYQATHNDGDTTTIVEADRSGNVHTATFDRNGNRIESESDRISPQEAGRRYFEEKLGGRDWDNLPKSLRNQYADSERQAALTLQNRAQQEVVALREQRAAAERERSDTALAAQTDRKLAAIAAEQKTADERSAAAQARVERNRQVEESHEIARDLQRQYDEAIARGDKLQAARVKNRQDDHHDRSTELLQHDAVEQREMEAQSEVRNAVAKQIRERAAIAAEANLAEQVKVQDTKDAITSKTKWLMVGSEMQQETSTTTRMADRELAKARATQQEVERMINDPSTTSAQRKVALEMRDLALVQEEGASRLLTDNMKISAAGYAIDAAMTATGTSLIAGTGKLLGRAVVRVAGAVVGEQVLASTAERMAARAGQRLAQTQAAEFLARKQAERIAKQALTKTPVAAATEATVSQMAKDIFETRGVADLAKTATKEILTERGVLDLAGTGVTRVVTGVTGLVSDDAAKWVGRGLATDVGRPIANFGDRAVRKVLPGAAVDAAKAGLTKAQELALTNVTDIPGKIRNALDGAASVAPVARPGVVQAALPDHPTAPVSPGRTAAPDAPAARPTTRPADTPPAARPPSPGRTAAPDAPVARPSTRPADTPPAARPPSPGRTAAPDTPAARPEPRPAETPSAARREDPNRTRTEVNQPRPVPAVSPRQNPAPVQRDWPSDTQLDRITGTDRLPTPPEPRFQGPRTAEELRDLHRPGRGLTGEQVIRKAEAYTGREAAAREYNAALDRRVAGQATDEEVKQALNRFEAARNGINEARTAARTQPPAGRAAGETLPPSGTGPSRTGPSATSPSRTGPGGTPRPADQASRAPVGPGRSAAAPRAAFTQDEIARLHEPGRALTPAEMGRRQELFKQRNDAADAYNKAHDAGRPAAEIEALGREADRLEDAIDAGRKAAYRAADPPGFREEMARLHEPGRALTPAELARRDAIYKQRDDALEAYHKAQDAGRPVVEADALGREAERLQAAIEEAQKAGRATGETLPPSGTSPSRTGPSGTSPSRTGPSGTPRPADQASRAPAAPGAVPARPDFTPDEIARLHEPGRALTPAELARRDELYKKRDDAARAYENAMDARRPNAEIDVLGREADRLDDAIAEAQKAGRAAGETMPPSGTGPSRTSPSGTPRPADQASRAPARPVSVDDLLEQRRKASAAVSAALDEGLPQAEMLARWKEVERLEAAIAEAQKAGRAAGETLPPSRTGPSGTPRPADQASRAPARPVSLDDLLEQRRKASAAVRDAIEDAVPPTEQLARWKEVERLEAAIAEAQKAGRAAGETLPPSGTGPSRTGPSATSPSRTGPGGTPRPADQASRAPVGPGRSAAAPRAAFTQDEIARLHEPGRALTPAEMGRRQELFKQRNDAADAYNKAHDAGRPAAEIEALGREADRLEDAIDAGRKAAYRAADPPGFREEMARLHEPGRALTPAELARRDAIYKQRDDALEAYHKAQDAGRPVVEADALGREAERLQAAIEEAQKAGRATGETLPPSGTSPSRTGPSGTSPSRTGPSGTPRPADQAAPVDRAARTEPDFRAQDDMDTVINPGRTSRTGTDPSLNPGRTPPRPGVPAVSSPAPRPFTPEEIAKLHGSAPLTQAELVRKGELLEQEGLAGVAYERAIEQGLPLSEVNARFREWQRVRAAIAEGRRAGAVAGDAQQLTRGATAPRTGPGGTQRLPDQSAAAPRTGPGGTQRLPDQSAAAPRTGPGGTQRLPDQSAAAPRTGPGGTQRLPDQSAAAPRTGPGGTQRLPDQNAAAPRTGPGGTQRLPDQSAAAPRTGLGNLTAQPPISSVATTGTSEAARALGNLADNAGSKRADWLSIPENVRGEVAQDAHAALRQAAAAGDMNAQRVAKALDDGSLKIEFEPGLKTPMLSLENGRALVNPMDGARVRSGDEIAKLVTSPPPPPVRLSSPTQRARLDTPEALQRAADPQGLSLQNRRDLATLDKREAAIKSNVRADVLTSDDLARMGDSTSAPIRADELTLDDLAKMGDELPVAADRNLARDARLHAIERLRGGILQSGETFKADVALRQRQLAAPDFDIAPGTLGASVPQGHVELGEVPLRQLVPGDKTYLKDIMKESDYVIGQGDVFVNSINKHVQQMIDGGFPLPRNPGPIQVRRLPDGKLIVEDGHHRLIAAIIASRLTGRRLLPNPANPAARSIIPPGQYRLTEVVGHHEADWGAIGVRLGDEL